MIDLAETAAVFRNLFGLSDDAARRAAVGRDGNPDDALPPEERDRRRVQRMNEYIAQCRQRRSAGGRR